MKKPKSPIDTTAKTAKDSVAQTAKMRFLPPIQSTLENHFENSSMMSHFLG